MREKLVRLRRRRELEQLSVEPEQILEKQERDTRSVTIIVRLYIIP
jgi:hypothetical protein